MVLMGCEFQQQGQAWGDAEGYGPEASPITGGQRALGGRAGKNHRDCDSEYCPLGNEDRARRMVGI